MRTGITFNVTAADRVRCTEPKSRHCRRSRISAKLAAQRWPGNRPLRLNKPGRKLAQPYNRAVKRPFRLAFPEPKTVARLNPAAAAISEFVSPTRLRRLISAEYSSSMSQ
jgi:hypothetical protein